jgi:spermidine/putrescine transport system substrate-binding protein
MRAFRNTLKVFVFFPLILLLSCSGREGRVLYIYNWSDYISPEVIKNFEEEYNCRIIQDSFDSNESMLAKLNTGITGYDIIFPSDYMALVMHKKKMLSEIDRTLIPNLKYIDSRYVKKASDPGMKYSVPYAVSFGGIGYNRLLLPFPPDSWNIFYNTRLKGKMTMLRDMRETIGAALKSLGYSLNSVNDAELEKAKKVLSQWKKNIACFDVEEAKKWLMDDKMILIHQYNGDIMYLMAEDDKISFSVPREGGSISTDVFVIPSTAVNKELAHKFINYIYTPEICARNMEYIYFLTPNRRALELISPELKNNPMFMPPREILEKCEVIRDLGENNKKYAEIWNVLLAGE